MTAFIAISKNGIAADGGRPRAAAKTTGRCLSLASFPRHGASPAPSATSSGPLVACASVSCAAQLFYSFFKTLIGREIVVELKNDVCIRGTLHSVDQFLNIKLHDIKVTDEAKYPHMVCIPSANLVTFRTLPHLGP